MLRRTYFRRIWAAMTVSSLGDWLGVFALTLFVQRKTGNSEFAVGGVLFFRVLPALLFAQVAGVLADRFDRRRLMITADLARAGLIASVPFIPLWTLFVVSAVMEMLSLLWTPAKDATIPNLVEREELLIANQLSLITTYGTFPISGALVALLAVVAGWMDDTFTVLRNQPTALAFFVDAATFLFSATMVWTLPHRLMRAKRARTQFSFVHAFRDLAEGWRFVRGNRVVRTLVGAAWIAFTGGSAVISLGPFMALALKGGAAGSAQAWGSLIVSVGTGLVGGMITAGALARHVDRDKLFPAGLATSGIAVVLTATVHSFTMAVATAFFAGLGAGIAWVTIFTLLQERTDDRLRGRTFATLYTGVHLSLFAGLGGWPLAAGLAGDHVLRVGGWSYTIEGFRIMLWIGGITLGAAGLVSARSMRRSPSRVAARLRGLEFRPRTVSGGARRGLFIVFEGVEGSGKSTMIAYLTSFLKEFGKDVVLTREPGGTAIGERIRRLLLDPEAREMDSKAEALLYAAARAQHVAQVVRPALESGKAVISDRYLDSSLAYQGLARGLGDEDVYRLNIWATDELIPDLVVLLDLDPEVGLARAAGAPDRIEQEDIAFHRKVAEAYQQLAKTYPSRFALIDASQPVETVREQVERAVYNVLHE
ncbi:MAG: dTMP kinase [Actinomycetota bacterium]